MDLSLFLSFPGILIVVGIALLLAAIIIGIIAYKTVDDEAVVEVDETPEEVIEESKEEVVEEKELTKEDLLSNTMIMPAINENINNEEKLEEPAHEVIIEDVKESNKEDELDLLLDEFIEEENDFVELSKDSEYMPFDEEEYETPAPIMNGYIDELEIDEENQNEIKEEVQEVVNEKEELIKNEIEERPIYGGAKPLENVNLHFDDDVRKPVYKERFHTMEIPIIQGNEVLEQKEVKAIEEEEEIELL